MAQWRGGNGAASTEVAVAGAPGLGKVGEEEKALSDGVDQTIRDFATAVLTGYIEPEVFEVGFGVRGDSVRH